MNRRTEHRRATSAVRLLTAMSSACFAMLLGCSDSSHESASVPIQSTSIPVQQAPASVAAEKSKAIEKGVRSVPKPLSQPSVSFNKMTLTDIAQSSGIDFTYENGASAKALMVEATGGGCGWLDYDLDGLLDLHVVQGGEPDARDSSTRPPDRLYRNLNGSTFVDVAKLAGVEDHEYGQGVAVGDYNDDGFDDLFITNCGHNTLYQNQGDGTFVNISDSAGLKWNGWSSSAAWGDLDRDGDLDLYVCHYVEYDPKNPIPCPNKEGIPSICHPRNAPPSPDECFENLGDGSFRPIAEEWGLTGPENRALGVAITDFTDDGWPDIYVANDTTPNFLFISHEGRSFKESALSMGAAVSMTGNSQASMGVAVADYDQNGLPDIYLTHFTGEWNTLYQNLGPSGFQDVSPLTGMRELTLPKLGFGTVMLDFNADGYMDVFVTNGHIDPLHSDGEGYEMTPQLMSFNGSRWIDQSSQSGSIFGRRCVGRGVAHGDFDNDGDVDLAVVHQNSPIALLRNDSKTGHWLRIRFVGHSSNRRGVGSHVKLMQGEKRLVAELSGGTSYASAHEPVLYFGLGEISENCDLEIRWPSGKQQSVTGIKLDQTITLHEPLD